MRPAAPGCWLLLLPLLALGCAHAPVDETPAWKRELELARSRMASGQMAAGRVALDRAVAAASAEPDDPTAVLALAYELERIGARRHDLDDWILPQEERLLASTTASKDGYVRGTVAGMMGWRHYERHEPGPAAGYLQQAVDAFEPGPARPDLGLALDDASTLYAFSLSNLALAVYQSGDPERAAVIGEQALAAKAGLMAPDDPSLLRTRANLGLAQVDLHRDAEAVESFRVALGPLQHDPVSATSMPGWRIYQAVALARLGQPDVAEAAFRLSMGSLDLALRVDPSVTASNLWAHTGVVLLEGHFAWADPMLRTLLQIYARSRTPVPRTQVAQVTIDLGLVNGCLDRPEEAEAFFRHGLGLLESEGDYGGPWADGLLLYGTFLEHWGRQEEARALLDEAGRRGREPADLPPFLRTALGMESR